MIDTHAHLDFRQFNDDRDAVLARAWRAGVKAIVTIGTNLSTSRAAVALAESNDRIYATVGLHPHDAKSLDDMALAELTDLTRRPSVVAVGEIGLDYYRDHSPRDIQRWAFRRQLDLAAQMGKPVVIHNREAHSDTLAILREWVTELEPQPAEHRGVFHCFSGDLAVAKAAMKLGFYLGVDGPITYRNAHKLREIVRALPLNRLLIETDAPFLTPIPHRGKRNEPAYVRLVANKIADLKDISFDAVVQATTSNARALFSLEQRLGDRPIK